MVWPDKRVQELATQFIPAADEALYLLTGPGHESHIFRTVWVGSHFGGQGANSQGVYAFTPSGVLLGSTFEVQPDGVLNVMRRALNSWKQLRPEQRLASRPVPERTAPRWPWEGLYPKDGLVLQAFYRDLPRSGPQDEARIYWEPFFRKAWNQDFVWFRKDEARSLLPPRLAKGEEHLVPEHLIRRLARLHLLDNVRSISDPFEEKDVQAAQLRTRVVQFDGDLVVVRFEGHTRTSSQGEWFISSEQEVSGQKSQQSRGYDAKLLGWGTYSLGRERFVAFDLVAVGTRWGGSVYSARAGDLAPNPLGIALTLAEDKPAHRVLPFFAPAYLEFWK